MFGVRQISLHEVTDFFDLGSNYFIRHDCVPCILEEVLTVSEFLLPINLSAKQIYF